MKKPTKGKDGKLIIKKILVGFAVILLVGLISYTLLFIIMLII